MSSFIKLISNKIKIIDHSLLQGIFPTQGLNLGLWHYRQILYHLSHQGSPTTLKIKIIDLVPVIKLLYS